MLRFLGTSIFVALLLALNTPSLKSEEGAIASLSSPEKNFEELWHIFNNRYAFFEVRGVDWQSQYQIYRPQVTQSTTDDLFEIMCKMLKPLNDGHVELKTKNPRRRFCAEDPPRFSIAKPATNQKPLRLAIMGVGNITGAHAMSWAGTKQRRHIATLLCDADERRMAPINPMIARPDVRFPKCFPDAIRTQDYRTAFEQYGDEFDAVLCGSADHHHFGVSKLALEHGKPIYCEKPICWSPLEGFILHQLAAKAQVPTQMGNQGNSANGWRVADAYYQNGHLGEIVEVHGWIYNDGPRNEELRSFTDTPLPIPEALDWSAWNGPAGAYPHVASLHPGAWRWWIPFGGGYIGDWGCHVFGGLFKTLGDKGYPSKVEVVKATEYYGEQFPRGMTVKWTFPGRNGKPQLDMYFHTARFPDPAFQPPRPDGLEADKSWPPSRHGCVWKGTKGTYVFNEGHNLRGAIIPDQKRRDIAPIESIYPKRKGNSFKLHGDDWVSAIRGEKEWNDTISNFDYGAYLSAVAQMGNSALRAGHAIAVDPTTGYPLDQADSAFFTRQNPNQAWYDLSL